MAEIDDKAAEFSAHPVIRAMRWEHGASADGHRLVVCNAMTGHFYRAVAFCETEAHASDMAEAINAMFKARTPVQEER